MSEARRERQGRWLVFGLALPVAAFGLMLVVAGATKPFPGFGLLPASLGLVGMTMVAVEAWREVRRAGPPSDEGPTV
jgi:hypothetical protein